MRVFINDKEVVFPSSLSEYTLGQRIAFHNEHGAILDKMLESILKMEDDEIKEIEIIGFQMEKMFRSFAFFAGTTVEAIKESKFIDDVASVYYSCLAVLFDEEEKLELCRTFTWKEETWELSVPELKHGDKMKFGEFIDAKQVVKDMSDLGHGKWEAMLHLCAIYLRKKGEPYQQEFLYEGSERMEMMKELPMDIALQVGFFLTGTMNFYMNTSKFSEKQRSKEPVSM
jgi:hypothetical protein